MQKLNGLICLPLWDTFRSNVMFALESAMEPVKIRWIRRWASKRKIAPTQKTKLSKLGQRLQGKVNLAGGYLHLSHLIFYMQMTTILIVIVVSLFYLMNKPYAVCDAESCNRLSAPTWSLLPRLLAYFPFTRLSFLICNRWCPVGAIQFKWISPV